MSDFGNPLLNQPPTTVNVGDVTQQEIDPRKRAELEALGHKDAGWFSNLWAGLWASIVDGVSLIVTDFAGTLDTILAGVGKLFLLGQGEKTPAFYDLAGTILEDLTGVKVDTAALKQSAFGSGRLAGMQTFGADLYKLLEAEFKPASGQIEEGDAAPAEKLLGFLMNFAIRQGNIELLTSMLPESWRVGDGFRAYGENMAHNLGLSRMARRGLQPLIQTTVADPLQYLLNEQYRPKRLAKEQAIKKFFRDPSVETQMRKEMAQEGFSDTRMQDLIDDARPLLAEREIVNLAFRFGATTSTVAGQPVGDVKTEIMQRGYSDADAQRLIDLSRPLLKENEIALLVVNGAMDQTTALSHFAKLGYDDATAQLALQAHSFSHLHAHRLGLGVLRKAFKDNVIDLLEFKAKLAAQGFAADDIDIIVLEELQPIKGTVRKLSLAEIKAGFKAGALTEQLAVQHLGTLGYSDADIAVILKSIPPKKAPATPTTPPAA
jgi:hypothetical protein